MAQICVDRPFISATSSCLGQLAFHCYELILHGSPWFHHFVFLTALAEAEEEEDADGGAAPLTMSTHGKRQTQGGVEKRSWGAGFLETRSLL